MKPNSPISDPSGHGQPRRRSFSLAILVCAGLIVSAGVYYFLAGKAPGSASAPAQSQAAPGDELDSARVNPEVVSPDQPSSSSRSPVVIRRMRSPADGATPEVTVRPANTNTPMGPSEQAVARLSGLDVSQPLTAERAAAVKQDLQQLVGQGTNALTAIQAFLKQNRDLSLDETKGSSPVGYASMRSGMFDVLRQIGGPAAESVLADTLRTTADPSEIGLLARNLEELAPGQHREEIVAAARDTLAQLAQTPKPEGGNPRPDAGPLFEVLQKYGDANVVSDLQKNASQWKYYGLIALAGLPEGQGVPALIEQAGRMSGNGTATDIFAIQMLAQVSPQNADASAALINEAKAGQIPDRAWRRIADALAGDQYQFVKDPNTDSAALMRTPGVKTYHIEAPNENFYSVPLPTDAADAGQRRALIDQLLGATSNPTAQTVLQQAKAQLTK